MIEDGAVTRVPWNLLRLRSFVRPGGNPIGPTYLLLSTIIETVARNCLQRFIGSRT